MSNVYIGLTNKFEACLIEQFLGWLSRYRFRLYDVLRDISFSPSEVSLKQEIGVALAILSYLRCCRWYWYCVFLADKVGCQYQSNQYHIVAYTVDRLLPDISFGVVLFSSVLIHK